VQTGVGSLYGITAGSIHPGGDGVLVPMLVTSGQLDSYALPDIDQILFSVDCRSISNRFGRNLLFTNSHLANSHLAGRKNKSHVSTLLF